MAVLVTGAGMVGSQVASCLLERGETPILYDVRPRLNFLATVLDLTRVKVVTGDVTDMAVLLETIKDHKVERVIHTAAYQSHVLRGRPFLGIEANILGTGVVLEAARLTGVRRVVFASSGAMNLSAFNVPVGGTVDEDFEMKCLSTRPKNIYAISKMVGEYMGLMYNDSYGVDFAALRLGGGFGPAPGMPNGAHARILWKHVYNPALGKDTFIDDPGYIFSGFAEYIYAKDDANALVLACFAPNLKRRVYNVHMGRAYTYSQMLDVVRKVFPSVRIEMKVPMSEVGGSSAHEGRGHHRDMSAARDELGWVPQFDLEAGISDWAQWIRHNEAIACGV